MLAMDESLRQALRHLLEEIERGEEVVQNLLLVELDWGPHTPPVADESAEIEFQGRPWPLAYTDSELVLRQCLCRAPRGQAIFVFRADNGFQIPADIRARAHGGTCCRLGMRHRLYALTERGWPVEVDYAEWRPSIERHFDNLVAAARGAGLKWDMTRTDLEMILVQAAFGLKVEGHQAPDLLADLVTSPRPQTAPTPLERSLLRGQLRLHGVAWPEIVDWAAAEPERARELVRTGVMMDAEQAARRMPNWGRLNNLRALLVSERGLSEQEAMAALVQLSADALAKMRAPSAQAIARDAEKALEGVLPAEAYNRWFPGMLERECAAVARRLASRDLGALSRVARLQEHLFVGQFQGQLRVLGYMAELVRLWEQQSPVAEALAATAEWAAWYATHGARLDLCALKLTVEGQQGTGLESIQTLLDRYWAWRDEHNLTFARSYLAGYEAALHDRTSGIFGTHRVLDWVVRPRLQGGQRVLLVVVDGMGLPAFWHLVDQWSKASPPVHLTAVDEVKAALSLLPSVTSVSRKGLFLNALPTDRLDDEQAYEEKARAREGETLARAFPKHGIKLYTKTNLGSGQELLNDLQFRGADLLAVVLNAIDDDVQSTTTTVRLPLLQDLGPLVSAVRTGLEAGWAVVLTADHGHTWHRHKNLRRGDVVPGGGERFAPAVAGKEPPADAVVTGDPHILRVQEANQVAMLTAVGSYFGRIPRRGYHGGASLEEVVVPCALLTLQAPLRSTAEEAKSDVETAPEPAPGYDLSGVIVTLPGGQMKSLDLPFALSATEARILQALARMGEASEEDLRRALGTRRIAGPMAALRDRLAAEGRDLIEQKGAADGGVIYRFRAELLE